MTKKNFLLTLFLFSLLSCFSVFATDYVRCTASTNTTTLYLLNTSTCSYVRMGSADLYDGLYNLTPTAAFTVQNLYTALTLVNQSTLNLEATSVSAVKNVTLNSNTSVVLGAGNYTLNTTAGTIYFNLTNPTFSGVAVTVYYNKTFGTSENLYLSTLSTHDGTLRENVCIQLTGYHSLIDGQNWSASWNTQANCTEVLVDFGTIVPGLPKTGEHLANFMIALAPAVGGILFIIALFLVIVGIVAVIAKRVEKGWQ